MAGWQYHDEDDERRSWWGQTPQYTILSAESAGGNLPTVTSSFDGSVEDLLQSLK
jgi:hypothetical protein